MLLRKKAKRFILDLSADKLWGIGWEELDIDDRQIMRVDKVIFDRTEIWTSGIIFHSDDYWDPESRMTSILLVGPQGDLTRGLERFPDYSSAVKYIKYQV